MYHFSIYELPANNLDTENYGLLADDAVKPSRYVATFLEEPVASMCYTENQAIRRDMSEDCDRHIHCSENLRSHVTRAVVTAWS
jgi:hypothetical protein